jgi:multiple sugar transport system substrate-binding protein
VPLRFATYGGPEELRSYHRLARAFMREHPGVTVSVESAPNGSASRRRLDGQFADGTGPDVFLTNSSALPSLVADGRVQPVDGLLEERGIQFGDNYERLGLEAMAANSALQCMPSDVSPYVVFYNKRLLDTSLLPTRTDRPPMPQRNGWSWNQFTVAAAQMSRGKVKGVYLPPDLRTLTPLMRSAGSDVVDDPKTPTSLTLSPPPNRGDLEKILDVARNQTITLTPRELAQQPPVSRFMQGKLGMMIGTRALVPRLRHNRELRFDVYPMPSLGRSQTVAEVSGYCINRETRHQSEAADFLAFASSDRGAAITAASGGIVPANLNVAASDTFKQIDRFPLNVDVFNRVIRRATTMPDPPAWPEVVHQTRPLLRRLFYAQNADFDLLLPRIDAISVPLLAPPTETPSPTGSPTGSPAGSPGGSPGTSATPTAPSGTAKMTPGTSPN